MQTCIAYKHEVYMKLGELGEKKYRGLDLLKAELGIESTKDVVELLVRERLMITRADIGTDFVPVGGYVRDSDGNHLKIVDLVDSMVVFDDGTYVINGSPECYSLVYLAADDWSYSEWLC